MPHANGAGADAGAASGTTLDEVASKDLLRRYGIPVPRGLVVSKANEVDDQLMGLRPPLALKVVARGISHKSDVGGVRLGLASADAVRAAILAIESDARISRESITGYLVEEMAPPGHELVIGGIEDLRFGPMLMVGLGGIFVEVLKDIAFRACPIEERDAIEMINGLHGAPILKGARGGIRADMASLVAVMMRIGGAGGLLLDSRHRIRELDINPIVATDKGAVAVDARLVVA